MRAIAALISVALLGGGCQTARQSWICAGAGLGIAAVGGLAISAASGDEEATDLNTAGLFLLASGGLMAVFSAINAVAVGDPPAAN